MEITFDKKLRAAVAAGWWTVLIGAAIVTLQWIAYLAVLSAQPQWMLDLWGPGMSWSTVRTVWISVIAALKGILAVQILVILWATIWSAKLRKSAITAEAAAEQKTEQAVEQRRGVEAPSRGLQPSS